MIESASVRRRAAGRVALVGLLAALVVLIYRDSFRTMADLWSLSSYKHGYVIAPVAMFLLWRDRTRLASEPISASAVGLAICALLVVTFVAGKVVSAQVVEHTAIVLMIPALVLAVFGRKAFQAIAFPLLFLIGAVPAGEGLIPFLLDVTADVSEWLLRASGIPVLREGMLFALPGGTFEIAEVCSGLRYLLAGMISALLFAYLNFSRWWKRVAFVLLATVSFVLANSVRAYIVMAVASWSNGRILGGADHIYFGMVLFAVVLVALLWFGLQHADTMPAVEVRDEVPPSGPSKMMLVTTVIAGAAILSVGPPWAKWKLRDSQPIPQELVLPSMDSCRTVVPEEVPWRPPFRGATMDRAASYECDGSTIHAFVALYGSQKQGAELASKGNPMLPRQWRATGVHDVIRLHDRGGRAFDINEIVLRKGGVQFVAWYWFAVNGVPVHTEVGVKFHEAFAVLGLRTEASAAYVIVAESSTEGESHLRDKLRKLAPDVWSAVADSKGPR